MFSKRILTSTIHYIEIIPYSYFKRKCGNLKMLNFISRPLLKVNLRYYSSDKSWENQLLNDKNQVGNSKERIKLENWVEMLRYEGARVPQKISEDQYVEILSLLDERSRMGFLNYLFKKEIHEAKDVARKEREKALKLEKRMERESKLKGHIEYGLWKYSMFTKVNHAHLKSLGYNRLVNAMKFGQPLVIDMDFYNYMEKREVQSLAKQLTISITQNRVNPDPFNMILCNVDFNCQKFKIFPEKYMPNVLKPNFPMDVTSKSYLDLFPKEKLIYLTNNARMEMETFDHDAIYIIGGYVDLKEHHPLTLAKAKRENIQTMKLPLERYHVFRGQKSLAIHVMINIMLDLQKDGDFNKAFRNIPRRLVMTGDKNHLDPYDYKKQRKF